VVHDGARAAAAAAAAAVTGASAEHCGVDNGEYPEQCAVHAAYVQQHAAVQSQGAEEPQVHAGEKDPACATDSSCWSSSELAEWNGTLQAVERVYCGAYAGTVHGGAARGTTDVDSALGSSTCSEEGECTTLALRALACAMEAAHHLQLVARAAQGAARSLEAQSLHQVCVDALVALLPALTGLLSLWTLQFVMLPHTVRTVWEGIVTVLGTAPSCAAARQHTSHVLHMLLALPARSQCAAMGAEDGVRTGILRHVLHLQTHGCPRAAQAAALAGLRTLHCCNAAWRLQCLEVDGAGDLGESQGRGLGHWTVPAAPLGLHAVACAASCGDAASENDSAACRATEQQAHIAFLDCMHDVVGTAVGPPRTRWWCSAHCVGSTAGDDAMGEEHWVLPALIGCAGALNTVAAQCGGGEEPSALTYSAVYALRMHQVHEALWPLFHTPTAL